MSVQAASRPQRRRGKFALAGCTRADVVAYSLKGNPADILIKDVDLSTGAARLNYIVPKNYAGRRHSLTAACIGGPAQGFGPAQCLQCRCAT